MTKLELLKAIQRLDNAVCAVANTENNEHVFEALDRIERILLALVEKLPEDKI